uniref:Uncharacterized protein n=1 Tax=Arundo donax TaxID=35708 RepID=A0A0A9A2N6_ARUDO
MNTFGNFVAPVRTYLLQGLGFHNHDQRRQLTGSEKYACFWNIHLFFLCKRLKF